MKDNTLGTLLRGWSASGLAIAAGLVLGNGPTAHAGWSGSMSGTGFGWAGVNVTSSTGLAGSARTAFMTGPSAAMAPSGYAVNAPLPSGSSSLTVAKIRGLPGGIWQAETGGYNGDRTDNAELEKRITIRAADCPSLTMDSEFTPGAFNGNAGTITVRAAGTAGTALWLRGFEYDGDQSLLPIDDPATPDINETIEFLKLHAVQKFETLVVGPFEYGTGESSCPLVIPFSLESGDLNNLIFTSDGVAKSTPLEITCPSKMIVSCDSPFSYPAVDYKGCGDVTVTFNPPAPEGGTFPPGSFPVGTTQVTVTVTEIAGPSTSCTFEVEVKDTVAPVIIATGDPQDGNLGFNPTPAAIEAALGTALVDDNCGPLTPSAQTSSVSVNGCLRSQTRTWTAVDSGGNPAVHVSRTVTWTVDTTPPTASLAPYTVSCSELGSAIMVPVPSLAGVTDNCGGVVTVSPNAPQIYDPTSDGVIWRFTDAAGNYVDVKQRVSIASLVFNGFHAPISGSSLQADCSKPLRTINIGSNVPIKFDTFCSGASFVRGRPRLEILECSGATLVNTDFTLINNQWHFNWDTTGWARGTYTIRATLQDSSHRFAVIRLR